MAALTDTQINRLFGFTPSHGEHVKALYQAALAAEDTFRAAVKATGAKDWWSMTAAQLVSVRAEYLAKVAADKALTEAIANR